MKKEILILAVAMLLTGPLVKADVDNTVKKFTSYNCKNKELMEFYLIENKNSDTTIQFSDQKLNSLFSDSEIQLVKIEKSQLLMVKKYELLKNSQVLATLNLAISKQYLSDNCGRSSRAPCFDHIYLTAINAEIGLNGITYDFVCTKN
jgi:hypothetical protein